MNAVVTDSRHDQVELEHISHELLQLGQSGGRNINTKESHRNHGEGGEVGRRDEPTANDDSSNKAQAATRGESSLLKADVIPRFHGTSNSSVIKANPFRTF